MSDAARLANMRASKRFAKQDYDKQVLARGGQGGDGLASAGPPSWSRPAWDAFKAQYGSYPFGMQTDGSFIAPPTYAGAPDWVYALMGLRKPPIAVHSGADLTR